MGPHLKTQHDPNPSPRASSQRHSQGCPPHCLSMLPTGIPNSQHTSKPLIFPVCRNPRNPASLCLQGAGPRYRLVTQGQPQHPTLGTPHTQAFRASPPGNPATPSRSTPEPQVPLPDPAAAAVAAAGRGSEGLQPAVHLPLRCYCRCRPGARPARRAPEAGPAPGARPPQGAGRPPGP